MRDRVLNFMRGRHGVDQFSYAIFGLAFLMMVINIFWGNIILTSCVVAMLILGYFRVLSRNHIARNKENTIYLQKTYKLRMWGLKQKDRLKIRKTHHIYSCPQCKQKVKIPKGKGKISITCPKCKTEFVRNSR